MERIELSQYLPQLGLRQDSVDWKGKWWIGRMNSNRSDMQNHNEYARQVLNEARRAHKDGHYALSLEKYDWFFEHALDEDKSSLYGVRLSYCLQEWTALGQVYPAAIQKLQATKTDCITKLEATRNPNVFHDFVSISEYLNETPDTIKRFIHYHQSDSELAKLIVSFIWDNLIKSGEWEVCCTYVEDPSLNYSKAIEKYRAAMGICNSDPKLGGENFAAQIRGWYVQDVTNLLSVLTNNARHEEAELIRQTANTDIDRDKIDISKFDHDV